MFSFLTVRFRADGPSGPTRRTANGRSRTGSYRLEIGQLGRIEKPYYPRLAAAGRFDAQLYVQAPRKFVIDYLERIDFPVKPQSLHPRAGAVSPKGDYPRSWRAGTTGSHAPHHPRADNLVSDLPIRSKKAAIRASASRIRAFASRSKSAVASWPFPAASAERCAASRSCA